MKLFWFIPTHGDSRYLGTSKGARAADFNYFKQVAVAADSLGYEGVLLPTGRSCEDSWVVASSLIGATERLKFLVALRPGLVQPAQSARMAATLDRLSGGRLLVNLVTGGDPEELEGDGQFLSHAERYQVSREFITIWRELLARSHAGDSLDFDGRHLQVKGGKVLYPPVSHPYPPIYFGGSSEEAHELAAAQLDTYLTWGEPPAAVAAKVADITQRAARHGRKLDFGIRLHVIVRETNEAAWKAADELIQYVTDETVAAAQKSFAKMDSVGQQHAFVAQAVGGDGNLLEVVEARGARALARAEVARVAVGGDEPEDFHGGPLGIAEGFSAMLAQGVLWRGRAAAIRSPPPAPASGSGPGAGTRRPPAAGRRRWPG